MKDYKYYIGLTLVVLTFVTCVISFYLLVFGLPLFVIGAILIFFSDKSVKTKILTTVIPILLWFPTTFLFLYFYSKTTPETYLIQDGFRGKIRVIYNESCGLEPKEENGRRILEIPNNGILIIKSEFETGTIDHEYYFVDKNGNRSSIYRLYKGSNTENHKQGIYLDGTGSFGGQMPDGSFSSESPLAIHFSDLYVCGHDSDQFTDYRHERRFDSLTQMLVDKCRQRK